jgi:CheY-like chemotaxis protein
MPITAFSMVPGAMLRSQFRKDGFIAPERDPGGPMARNILLMDYDSRSIGQVRNALQAAGMHVRLALDGISGIEEFHTHRPDLVLVKDLLPRKLGREVCRDLKRTDAGRRTPVLLITAEGGAGHAEIRGTGCDDIVTSPLNEGSLLERVREHLSSPGDEHGARSFEIALGAEDIDSALDVMTWDEQPPQEAKTPPRPRRKTAPKKTSATRGSTKKDGEPKAAGTTKKAASRKKTATRKKSSTKKKSSTAVAKKKTAKKNKVSAKKKTAARKKTVTKKKAAARL